MTDFDEGYQDGAIATSSWSSRTIGNKHGTGGSLGVEFLKQSLFMPIFADLWPSGTGYDYLRHHGHHAAAMRLAGRHAADA